MIIDIDNHSGVEVDLDSLHRQADFVLTRLRINPESELSITLCDESEMTELHIKWMDEPGPTDVLSFPMDELRPGGDGELPEPGMLGDIVICPQVAQRQAETAGHKTADELELLLAHGILHLLGYDHAEPEEHAQMFGLQQELLAAWTLQS